jgi:uncharacterized membrane protein
VTDQRLEVLISTLLRTGVLLSAAVVLLGAGCYLSEHGGQQPEYHVFHGAPDAYRSISGVVHAAAHFDCPAVIQLGLLLLILTPIARVGLALAGFALERDGTYVLLTSIVLVILVYSLAGPH